MDRLESLGQAPKLAPVADHEAAKLSCRRICRCRRRHRRCSRPIRCGGPVARSFFRDPRASHIGDILTVNVSIADAAQISDTTARSRKNSDDAGLTNFFGLEDRSGEGAAGQPRSGQPGEDGLRHLQHRLGLGGPQGNHQPDLGGAGRAGAANGNLVITGHQQVRVNNELRDLQISGIVRPEDITNANTVDLSQIAEARISYGGKGTITDVQTPRWGSEVFDSIMPF